MNERDIKLIADDASSAAVYDVVIRIENGRLDPTKRAAVAAIIQRVCTGLTQQLDWAAPDRYEIELKRRSSSHGEVELDIGAGNEDR